MRRFREDVSDNRGWYLAIAILFVLAVLFFAGAFDDFKSKSSGSSSTGNNVSSSTGSSQPADTTKGKTTSDNKSGGGIGVFGTKPSDNNDGGKPPAIKTAGTGDTSNNCPGDHPMAPNDTYTAHAGCLVKGEVEVNGQSAHTSDGWGNLLVCNVDCPLFAKYGANVSNRTFVDLYQEMQTSGCANQKGCGSNIHCWTYNGTLAAVNCLLLSGQSANSQPSGNGCNAKACPGDVTQQSVNDCGGELKRGETRTIKAGCTIVGDVIANGKLQKAGMNGRNDVGFVQKLTVDTSITAPYQAGVYDSSVPVDSLVNITKIAGCDQGGGCSGGVYDWAGNRLDK